MNEVLKVLFNATISFIVLFIVSRLMGKKKIAQLDFMDYIVAISIGSIAAEMATELDDKYYLFIISMVVYLVLDFAVTLVARKANILKKIFRGQPLILINDGKINYHELKRCKLDVKELCSLCREKGYFDINDIAFAIFETNGSLSVMPKSNQKSVVLEDINIVGEKPELSLDVVVDGQVVEECLKQLNQSEKWLLEKLKIKDKKGIKKIALATYDDKKQQFIIHYKDAIN